MATQPCPQCGSLATDELPGGLCPACLMEVARQSQQDPDETAAMQYSFRTPSIGEMGNLFPELEILQMVGRGGMGAVYRVRQKNLDRIVALKVFLYKPDDPEFAARFQREARALAKLNHPNIVTVHDFGSRENVHFLIMEFVDGLNLRQVTAEERLSPEMALQMVPQLCDALQYAHDQGVIHRDIKPENLLMDTNGRIKIADFGLAKMTGSGNPGTLTHTRQVMGTLNYMAPEQRERPTEVDHRADIYSLGVVIYELLTGELPLGRFQPPSAKSTVHTSLDEVVMRALEKEPELRYQQASEFKTGFASVGDAEAVGVANHFVPAQAPLDPNRPMDPPRPVEPRTPVKSEMSHPGYDTSEPRYLVSIMSGREKKGYWQPGDPHIAFTLMAGTCLNLTEVQAPVVRLNLFTVMGATEVIVPHGAVVEMDGLILMGSTVDNVAKSNAPSTMRVVINNWGLMGGVEVRTPTPAEMPPDPEPSLRVADLASRNKPMEAIHLFRKETGADLNTAQRVVEKLKRSPMHPYREPREHEIGIRMGLVYLYKTLATMVGFSAAIVFLLSRFDVLPDDEGKMLAIVLLISCGMVWAGLGYFRRIIGAGPEENTAEAQKEYYSSTVIGTLIRSAALVAGFACPIMFVIANFENSNDEIRLVAILSAIGCGVLYTIAHYVEEFFYGKLKS